MRACAHLCVCVNLQLLHRAVHERMRALPLACALHNRQERVEVEAREAVRGHKAHGHADACTSQWILEGQHRPVCLDVVVVVELQCLVKEAGFVLKRPITAELCVFPSQKDRFVIAMTLSEPAGAL